MNAQDLRELLEKTDDKLRIFASSDTFSKYEIDEKELLELISDFLTDEEKLKLFDYSHFMQFSEDIRYGIIELVSDENIRLQMMSNDNIMDGLVSYQIAGIMRKMSDYGKKQILYNQEFIEKHQILDHNLEEIIDSLTDEIKAEILADIDLIRDKLHLTDFQIVQLAKGLSSEEPKIKILGIYQLADSQKIDIINTFNNNSKLAIMLGEKSFCKDDIMQILETLDVETLSEFFMHHKKFCDEHDIHPYKIICRLDSERQKDFVANLEHIDLTLSEKREILATLSEDIKQSIDTTDFPEEYKTALSIKTTETNRLIILELERELEDYRGLDNLIIINPEEFTQEQRNKFMKLCNICPNMQVINELKDVEKSTSTASEYKEAEEWITSLIDRLDPEYSKAQKLAVIDNAIGKK